MHQIVALQLIDSAINGNLPIVFGEVANKQDETVNDATQCFYDLAGLNQIIRLKPLLPIKACCKHSKRKRSAGSPGVLVAGWLRKSQYWEI